MADAREGFLVCLQGKYHRKRVGNDEERREPYAQRLSDPFPAVDLGDERRHEQGNSRKEKEARVKAGVHTIKLLLVMPEPTDEKRAAQHEKCIGNDGASD